jgi:hypothetical protein
MGIGRLGRFGLPPDFPPSSCRLSVTVRRNPIPKRMVPEKRGLPNRKIKGSRPADGRVMLRSRARNIKLRKPFRRSTTR